ncbi:MAG TPA: hypothetical protein VNL37_01565 [Candidatus Polarisedimenticolia bacterium]|nr:hypothetical protein [Candidatus Polarisedimenticolia bacterium]
MSRTSGSVASGAPAGGARLIVFLVLAAALSGGLILYTLRQRRPAIPADADHTGVVEPAACLTCHGPGRKNARGPNHPLNDQCFNCHERAG